MIQKLQKFFSLLGFKKVNSIDLDLLMIEKQTDLNRVNQIYPLEEADFEKKAESWIKKDPIVSFERLIMIIIKTEIDLEKKEILEHLIKKMIQEKDEIFFIKNQRESDKIQCKIYEKINQGTLAKKEKKMLFEITSLIKEKIIKEKEIKKTWQQMSFLLSQ